MASIPACHHWQSAGDPGSIPGRGALHHSFPQERAHAGALPGSNPGLCRVFTPHGGLAQMAERPLCMRQARGSMPLSSTHHNNHGDECVASRVRMFVGRSGDVAQMVERVLSMHEAMGSMPIFSTHHSLFARKHHQGFSSLGSIPSVRRHVYSRPFSSVGRAQVS